MKQFLLSIGFLFSFFIGFGQCPDVPNDVLSFSTQADLDSFFLENPNCTYYNLYVLYIGGEDINNLDAIRDSQLASMLVSIIIIDNTSLTSFLGFEDINIITDEVEIRSNHLLTTLDGLEGLNTLSSGNSLILSNNSSLVEIDGFSGVTNSIGYMQILSNPVLQSIDGLRNVSSGGYKEIIGNSMLTDCNITTVCSSIIQQIQVDNNPDLIDNVIYFQNNAAGPCSSFDLAREACITCGTEQLMLSTQSEVNNFSINYPDCTDFNYGILISGNDITDLTPLNDIISITGGLILEDNPNLESLIGLENLQFVDEIQIINNHILTDISSLGDLDAQEITNIEIQNNPQLSSCGLDPFCTYIVGGGAFTISNNGVNCDSGLDLLTFCGLELNQISGIVLYDFDNTGCESGDYSVSNLQITATNSTNTYSTLTDEQGNYTLFVGTGEVSTTIDQTSLPDMYTGSPSAIVQTFDDGGNSIEADFCIEATTMLHDVSITLLPLQEPRPGFEARYRIVYNNRGTFVESGEITFEFDDESVFFVDAEITANTITNTSLIWSYDNLLPFETRSFEVTFELFTPPTLIGGEILSSNLTITNVNGDDVLGNNISELDEVIVNSFDPNDKQVLQGAYILEEEVGDYLDYLVRFQNTGTADAINVVITDELSDNLNWGSLRMLEASHDYRVEITNGNDVSFIFDDINLPPEEQDEEGSNGFVAFQIRTIEDLSAEGSSTSDMGDTIENTAYIYFDFNEPIITNTVITTVSEPCPSGLTLSSQAEVNMFAVNFPDCTEIDGQLIIEGETITDLSPLSEITSVIEDIIIRNNPNLASLTDLSNLTTTGASVQIVNNSLLENLEGLEEITSIEGMLIIENNEALISLSGLNNLTSTSDLFIINNDNLEDLVGLGALTFTDGELLIEDNDSLESLFGLTNYGSGDAFSIVNNVGLMAMDGVGAFETLVLSIRDNPALVDVIALDQVESIGEILEIVNNDNLTSLDGLQNLSTIGFGFTLSGNEILTDITSLSDVLDPSMFITITDNPNLTVCDIEVVCEFLSSDSAGATISNNALNCNSVEEVQEFCQTCPTGDVLLTSQAEVDAFAINFPDCTMISFPNALVVSGDDIVDLSPLSQITTLETVTIDTNPQLVSLTGLENLVDFFAGELTISNNPLLVSLSGLGGFGSTTQIINNDSLLNLEGLNSLLGADELVIEGNDALQNLIGLDTYSAGFIFTVRNNVNLSSLEGLGNFNSIYELSIENNPILTDITALENLGDIGEILEIVNNDNLTSLNGLQNLSTIGFGFTLSGNEILTDITSLSDVLDPSMFISITDNPNLSICDIDVVCSFISNLSSPQTVTIQDNASGCDSVAAVEEECLLSVQEELLDNAITIYPNPTIGVLNIEFTSDIQLQRIDVFSVTGKNILTTQNASIDFTELAQGMYFARIQTNQGMITKKIVKK